MLKQNLLRVVLAVTLMLGALAPGICATVCTLQGCFEPKPQHACCDRDPKSGCEHCELQHSVSESKGDAFAALAWWAWDPPAVTLVAAVEWEKPIDVPAPSVFDPTVPRGPPGVRGAPPALRAPPSRR